MPFTEAHWNQVLDHLASTVDQENYERWIKNLALRDVKDNTVVLEASNSMTQKWIERLYLDRIRECCQEVGGDSLEVKVQPKADRSTTPDDMTNTVSSGPIPRRKQKFPTVYLNPMYTFDNFVVGRSNKYCYAMAKAVAEKPGSLYNPLFIHGNVGLGKTHLLQGICHQLLSEQEGLSILYLSCDNFIEQLIDAIQQGGLSKFRYKYRYVDILLIDDIHYLANKEQTQEEFFHIFNNLYTSQKQIILSSDSPPKEIPSLQERLVSRFRWGVVAHLEPPTYETRMAIVQKKAKLKNQILPNNVVEFIAKNFSQNIRELEGAVWKLESYSTLMNQKITLDLAKEVLSDLIQTSQPKIGMGEIQNEVTRVFDVKLSELQSKKRSQSIAVPRQVCMYLARKYTELSLDEIGDFFGGRDHSTVAHSIDKISGEMEGHSDLRQTIETIMDNLQRRSHEPS